ncbi:hypothetical protein GCM10029992_38510 [Glycomyces albus]
MPIQPKVMTVPPASQNSRPMSRRRAVGEPDTIHSIVVYRVCFIAGYREVTKSTNVSVSCDRGHSQIVVKGDPAPPWPGRARSRESRAGAADTECERTRR